MNKNIFRHILNYYDKEVVGMISEKYGYSELEAFRKYIYSETYSMMSNMKLEMWEFGCPAIFSMWECEQITGDPRKSSYLRG